MEEEKSSPINLLIGSSTPEDKIKDVISNSFSSLKNDEKKEINNDEKRKKVISLAFKENDFVITMLLKLLNKNPKNELIIANLMIELNERKNLESTLKEKKNLLANDEKALLALRNEVFLLEESRDKLANEYKTKLENEITSLKKEFKNARKLIAQNEEDIRNEVKKIVRYKFLFITIFNHKRVEKISRRLSTYNEITEEIKMGSIDVKEYDNHQEKISNNRKESILLFENIEVIKKEIFELKNRLLKTDAGISKLTDEYENNEKEKQLEEFEKMLAEKKRLLNEAKFLVNDFSKDE